MLPAVTSLLLAGVGLLLVGGSIALWLRWLRRVDLEGRRPLAYGLIAVGAVCAAAVLATGPGLAAGLLAGAALLLAAAWAVLGALAHQSRQAPAVAVGEPLPDFVAPDSRDEPFRIADLRGHPVLLKLFRGHW